MTLQHRMTLCTQYHPRLYTWTHAWITLLVHTELSKRQHITFPAASYKPHLEEVKIKVYCVLHPNA